MHLILNFFEQLKNTFLLPGLLNTKKRLLLLPYCGTVKGVMFKKYQNHK